MMWLQFQTALGAATVLHCKRLLRGWLAAAVCISQIQNEQEIRQPISLCFWGEGSVPPNLSAMGGKNLLFLLAVPCTVHILWVTGTAGAMVYCGAPLYPWSPLTKGTVGMLSLPSSLPSGKELLFYAWSPFLYCFLSKAKQEFNEITAGHIQRE